MTEINQYSINEIFEDAEDTGYRLCESKLDNTMSTSVFSSIWDPNNNNHLWITTQNGKLRLVNLLDRTVLAFRVVFRRVLSISLNDSSEEKETNYHFDKLVLIPGRPNELIFLLGISKSVMHTFLPPFSNSNIDYTGFIYGSPITQLSSHNYRITCLSVSDDGNILCSGDERGYIKVSILNIININLNNHLLMKKCHEGPIYSMQWLSKNNEIREDKGIDKTISGCLVTGSNDRSVIIWSISYSDSTSVQISRLLHLTTMTSSMLCFHSITLENSSYLCGGTDLGSVYVWRFKSISQLLMSNNYEAKIDDGSFLHSLLPSSDRPIVHISMTSSKIAILPLTIPQTRIAIVTGDTAKRVRFHFESNEDSNNSTHRIGFGPISYRYELTFPQPIVACSFQPNYEANKTSNLLVVLLDGFMQFYSLEETCNCNSNNESNSQTTDYQYGTDSVDSSEMHLFDDSVTGNLLSNISADAVTSNQAKSSHKLENKQNPKFKEVYDTNGNEVDSSSFMLNNIQTNIDDTFITKDKEYFSDNDDTLSVNPHRDIPVPSPKPKCINLDVNEEPRSKSSIPTPIVPSILNNIVIDKQNVRNFENNRVNSLLSNKKTVKNKDVMDKIKNTTSNEELSQDQTQSTYAYPMLNSSKAVQKRMNEIQQKLYSDEISISTIETTSTDRQVASRLVHSMVGNISKNLYSQLPNSSTEQETKSKLGKQVDPFWLHKRQNCGPTIEDVALLYPPDALVDLTFTSTSRNNNKNNEKVSCCVDPLTLFAKYDYRINLDEVFEDIERDKTFDYTKSEIDNYCQQYIYDQLSLI